METNSKIKTTIIEGQETGEEDEYDEKNVLIEEDRPTEEEHGVPDRIEVDNKSEEYIVQFLRDSIEEGESETSGLNNLENNLDTVEKQNLSLIVSNGVLSAFEDLLDCLLIMKHVIGPPFVTSLENTDLPLVERLKESDKCTTAKKPSITSTMKLQQDRFLLQTMVRKTILALMDGGGSFEPIETSAKMLSLREVEELRLLEETEENAKLFKSLSELARKKSAEKNSGMEKNELLYHLQDEIDDLTQKCVIEKDFVTRWETAREYQNKKLIEDEEKDYDEKIKKAEMKEDEEERVTNEVQSFLKNDIAELEEQLEYWMTYYDEEVERRDTKISQLRFDRGANQEMMNQLTSEIEHYKQSIRDWFEFKTEYENLTRAMIIIQAWWRGVMVRKKLGPYKVSKKKK